MIKQIDSWIVRNTKISFVFANEKIDGRKCSDSKDTRDLVYTSSLPQVGAAVFNFLFRLFLFLRHFYFCMYPLGLLNTASSSLGV